MAKSNIDKNRSTTASSLTDLAEDIVSLMIREHQKIQQELYSISQLTNDASRSLRTSFRQLSTRHDQLAANPTGTDPASGDPELSAIAAATAVNPGEYPNKYYDEVVSALQFDDIVSQISQHSQKRTQHIQLMFEELSAGLNELKASDFEYSPALDDKIIQLRRDIRQLSTELEKESPAKQARLIEGKIELF